MYYKRKAGNCDMDAFNKLIAHYIGNEDKAKLKKLSIKRKECLSIYR